MKIICFPEVAHYELAAFRPLIDKLVNERGAQFEIFHPSQFQAQSLKGEQQVWCLSRRWQMLSQLSWIRKFKGQVYVSVLESGNPETNLLTVLWKNFLSHIPSNVHLLCHSPLSYRYFTEILSLDKQSVTYLPVPFGGIAPSAPTAAHDVAVAGSYLPFNPESNFHFLLTVGHYVTQKRPENKFRFLGQGPLYTHLIRSAEELGVERNCFFTEATDPEHFREFDIFLYAPNRNDHFIPLLLAARSRKAVIAADLPGIADYIQDGKNGLMVTENDTKSMGELVVRLSDNAELRKQLGQRLFDSLESQFSLAKLWNSYLERFNLSQSSATKLKEAA